MTDKLNAIRQRHARKVEAWKVAKAIHDEAMRREVVTAGKEREAMGAVIRSARELEAVEGKA